MLYVSPWGCCLNYDWRWSAYCWRSPEVLAAIFFGEWRWGVVDWVNLMIGQVPYYVVFLFTKWVVTCCIPRIYDMVCYPNHSQSQESFRVWSHRTARWVDIAGLPTGNKSVMLDFPLLRITFPALLDYIPKGMLERPSIKVASFSISKNPISIGLSQFLHWCTNFLTVTGCTHII